MQKKRTPTLHETFYRQKIYENKNVCLRSKNNSFICAYTNNKTMLTNRINKKYKGKTEL